MARWVRCPRIRWILRGTAKQGANSRDDESLGTPVYDKLLRKMLLAFSEQASSISQMRPHQSNDWGAAFLLLSMFVFPQQRAGYFADYRRRR